MRFFVLLLSLSLVSGIAHAKSPIRFKDVSSKSGIADEGLNGAGVGFGDYDNDGDIDIYITNSDSNTAHLGIHNRLWENDGSGGFRDVSELRGVANLGGLGRGVSWGDFDNDGDSDLLVGNMQNSRSDTDNVPTTLYKNLLSETGEPNFENITRQAGLMRSGHEIDKKQGGLSDTSGGIAWADYNNDGWLDVLWRTTDYTVDQALFRNNGDGTFTEVTQEAGVNLIGRVLQANSQGSSGWFDFDQDGHLDLLSPNEGDANVLFHNNGDGTFTDVTRNRQSPSGIAFLNPGNANGVCLGDIDNDGDVDAYFPNADQANRLVRNDLIELGEANFTDITMASGAGDLGGARGCTMADYDNDGYLDIYVSNGGLSNTLINDINSSLSPFVQFYIAWTPANNTLLHNNGDGTFTDVTDDSGVQGNSIGTGVASGDINDDGFMDIIATSRTYYNEGKRLSDAQKNWVLLNRGNDNNWIKIKLVGTKSNRSAFNARVRVVAGELSQIREIYSSTGYNSVDDSRLNFGLAGHDRVDLIEVIWPSGEIQRLEDLEPRQILTIIEPS